MVGRGFVGDAAVSGGGVHVLVLVGDGPRFLPCRKFVLRLCFAFGLPARLGRLVFQTVCPTVWLPVFERWSSREFWAPGSSSAFHGQFAIVAKMFRVYLVSSTLR